MTRPRGVAEPVDARLGRDGPGLGPVGQGGAWHASTLRSGADTAGPASSPDGLGEPVISPPLTLTSTAPSGLVAGPASTEPSSMENALPWHGQMIRRPRRRDGATLVGADRREALELALGRLGDDDLRVREDDAAPDGDVGRGAERGAASRWRPGGGPAGRRRVGCRRARVVAAGREQRESDPHGGCSGERVASAECFLRSRWCPSAARMVERSPYAARVTRQCLRHESSLRKPQRVAFLTALVLAAAFLAAAFFAGAFFAAAGPRPTGASEAGFLREGCFA